MTHSVNTSLYTVATAPAAVTPARVQAVGGNRALITIYALAARRSV